jgi:predicted transcriptional regulator
MTRLLEEAIKRVRELPEANQDEAAEILLSLVSKRAQAVHLDNETRTAVQEGKAQADRGEFVPDEEMAAFFKRNGA